MLERCVACCSVTFQAGGHSHLEQPTTAMAWQEFFVQQFLLNGSCSCISVPACTYGMEWAKSWLFASTFQSLEVLAAICQHPPDAHQNLAGALDASGQCLSRITATYPAQFCDAFAQIVSPLLSKSGRNLSLSEAAALIPVKTMDDLPHARNDGGGLTSHADWSHRNSKTDAFQSLRQNWMRHIVDHQMDKQLLAYFSFESEHQPFPDAELEPLRALLIEFLSSKAITQIGTCLKTNPCTCIFCTHFVLSWKTKVLHSFHT